jgi:hypothetical protein
MTVSELIEMLEEAPPDYVIQFPGVTLDEEIMIDHENGHVRIVGYFDDAR